MKLRNINDARDFGCSPQGRWDLPNLRELTIVCESFELDLAGSSLQQSSTPYVPFDFQLDFPSVKKLNVEGYYIERIGIIAERDLPQLEIFNVLLDDLYMGYSDYVPPMPESLAAKIDKWEDYGGVWWTIDMLQRYDAGIFKPRLLLVAELPRLSDLATEMLPELTERTTVIVESVSFDESQVHDFHELVRAMGQNEVGPTIKLSVNASDVESECKNSDSRLSAARLLLAWLETMEDPSRNPRLTLNFKDYEDGAARRVAESFAEDLELERQVRRDEEERQVLMNAA